MILFDGDRYGVTVTLEDGEVVKCGVFDFADDARKAYCDSMFAYFNMKLKPEEQTISEWTFAIQEKKRIKELMEHFSKSLENPDYSI